MINFIWSAGNRLPAGTGGSENYTIGHVRELLRRGIPAQIVTIGLGEDDGRDDFLRIPFKSLAALKDVSTLNGTVIFVNEPHVEIDVPDSFLIMHSPPPLREKWRSLFTPDAEGRHLIATSRYGARIWSEYIPVLQSEIKVAYPFAEPCFADQERLPNDSDTVRILYAGRLSPEKGIYSFLEMLHLFLPSDLTFANALKQNKKLIFTITAAGSDKPQGKIIHALVKAHPNVHVVSARKTPQAMAKLMAAQDIVVMPSNSQYWHETFGIVSIEAQHSGCRVVASDDGGLPETDCGGLILVKPDDATALAAGVNKAIAHGPLSTRVRHKASKLFTVSQSVDGLLLAISSMTSTD